MNYRKRKIEMSIIGTWLLAASMVLAIALGCSPRTEFDYWQNVEPREDEGEMEMDHDGGDPDATALDDGTSDAGAGEANADDGGTT